MMTFITKTDRYCIRTLTRNWWVCYTDYWIVKYVDYIVVLLQQSIEHVSIVYTCVTYFAMHWVHVIY